MTHEELMLKSLPNYLRKDILALIEGYATKPLYLDCLYNEVQGSINGAMWDKEISEETADLLREMYL